MATELIDSNDFEILIYSLCLSLCVDGIHGGMLMYLTIMKAQDEGYRTSGAGRFRPITSAGAKSSFMDNNDLTVSMLYVQSRFFVII